jgi:hypothetical protein
VCGQAVKAGNPKQQVHSLLVLFFKHIFIIKTITDTKKKNITGIEKQIHNYF